MARETLLRKVLLVVLAMVVGFPAFGQIFPNEPAGSTLITDQPFNRLATPMNGTQSLDGWITSSSCASLINDPTAPGSPSSVLQYQYYAGFPGGIGPGNIYYRLPAIKEIYFAYWWKPSNPWQGHPSNVNKINFLWGMGSNGGNYTMEVVPEMYGPPGGPYKLITMTAVGDNSHLSGWGDATIVGLAPNVSNTSVSLGQWHRIEFYLKHSTSLTSRDGIIRWWMDGELMANYQSANFRQDPWVQFEVNPTWGGTGEVKKQTDYFWYDHVRISQPHGASAVPLYVSTGTLPAARSGTAYSATLQATGGKAPYNWTITSGSLLPGLSLNKSTGVISGTPTTGGRCDFTVKVLDSNVPPQEASKALTIVASGTSGIVTGRESSVANGGQIKISPKAGGVVFQVPQQGSFSVRVYDLAGRQVFDLGAKQAREINLNLKNGTYIARFGQNEIESASRFCVMN